MIRILVFVVFLLNVKVALCSDYIRKVVHKYDTILVVDYSIKNDTFCLKDIRNNENKCYSINNIESVGDDDRGSFVVLIKYSIEKEECNIQEVKRDSLIYINEKNDIVRLSKSEIYSYCINANKDEYINALHENTFIELYKNNKQKHYTITKKDSSVVLVYTIKYIDDSKISIEWEHSQKGVETIIKKSNILSINTEYQAMLWDNQIKEDYVLLNDNDLELTHINRINNEIKEKDNFSISGNEIFIRDLNATANGALKTKYLNIRKIPSWSIYVLGSIRHISLTEYQPGAFTKTKYNTSNFKEDFFRKGRVLQINVNKQFCRKFALGFDTEYTYTYVGYKEEVKENINYIKYGVSTTFFKYFDNNNMYYPLSFSVGGASIYTTGEYLDFTQVGDVKAEAKIKGTGYYYKFSSGFGFKLRNALDLALTVAYTDGIIENRNVETVSRMKFFNFRNNDIDDLSMIDVMFGIGYHFY